MIVLVLLGLLVVSDRFAAAYAESRIAGEVQKQGFGTRPDVTIYGFPFVTQVLDRHFPHAHMTARNVREGPITISRIDGDVRDVRVGSGFRKGTLGRVDGTATIAFGDLAKVSDQPGVKFSADGPDKVKGDVDFGIASGTVVWQVTKVGRNQIRVHPLSAEGFSLADLDQDLDFTVPVDGLPLGLTFQSLSVTDKGIELRVTGSHIAFSG
ncbi:LmeA family phospholipid-binding protein [Actinoallomurus sp. CA-150999]|uniref:LmeA family phospholipid-binding protein n=1 Tax=Actinoallomurus sp. CA-150999 TaxID=3239887 RepID=UPI003D91FF2E